MTRYARAGKGTHQRVAKDATDWKELKPPKPQRLRGSEESTSAKPMRRERFNKGFKGNKFSKHNHKADQLDQSDKGETSQKTGKRKNPNIRGFGQSKAVKVLGQFWVPLDDARRMKGLQQKLRSQGLPRKEIVEALKNERRKAEKSAKRQRDKTCFQCRQFGHVLSDCPNLKKAIAMPGSDESHSELIGDQGLVCFKCGSTEHTSRKCRKQGERFDFAKCFVCSGTGHIARQCPKNSKGIYPSGGSCSECGSTTHLKKDCPTLEGEDPSQAQDPDAVTLRVADPFSSTEYEPVAEENNDDNASALSTATQSFIKPTKFSKATKQPKSSANKRKSAEDKDFEFNIDADKPPTMKQNTLPKKRKIVKF